MLYIRLHGLPSVLLPVFPGLGVLHATELITKTRLGQLSFQYDLESSCQTNAPAYNKYKLCLKKIQKQPPEATKEQAKTGMFWGIDDTWKKGKA